MTYAPFTPTKHVQLTSVGLKKWKNKNKNIEGKLNTGFYIKFKWTLKYCKKKKKDAEKRATKKVQLVMQHCCKASWIGMLRGLLTSFKPVNNLICCKTGLMWVVKRATSLFNSLCHAASYLWKWKLYDFTFENRLVCHIFNKIIIVIWFLSPHRFLRISEFVVGHVTKVWCLKLWISFF